MADSAALSAAYESQRPRLLRVAYGTVGSVADAEDVVQEAWLRLARLPDPGQIEDLRAWLTRVVERLALDGLRRARRTREQYVGEWLPEPVVQDGAGAADLADRVTLDESVTMALLVVLESLSPAERPRRSSGAATAAGRSAPCAVRCRAATGSPGRSWASRVARRGRPASRWSTAGQACAARLRGRAHGDFVHRRRRADRGPSVDAQPRQAHPRRSAVTLARTRLAVPGRPAQPRPVSGIGGSTPRARPGRGPAPGAQPARRRRRAGTAPD